MNSYHPPRRHFQASPWCAIALGVSASLCTLPAALWRSGNTSTSAIEDVTAFAWAVGLIVAASTLGALLGTALAAARLAAQAARDQADTLAYRVAPALERLVEASGRPPLAPTPVVPPPEPAADHPARVRAAIAGRRWAEASARLDDLLAAEPSSPLGAMLSGTLERARSEAAVEVRGALDAARGIDDAARVMDLRAELAPLLAAEARATLDKDLVGWLMAKVRRGLADLPVRPDVVALADRVAGEFAATAEGASLRRALPVLRRTVGLCPRCAKPYKGVEDACPECLSGVVEASTGQVAPVAESGATRAAT